MEQPPLSPAPAPTPPAWMKMKPSPLTRILMSKQTLNQHNWTPDVHYPSTGKTRDLLVLKKHRQTNPMIWCSAILCLIFTLLVIFFGIMTLVVFLIIKPRNPLFDTNNARLNVIYFDSPDHFNGDFIILANFSNPNKKLHVRFEYAVFELYFSNNLISGQAIQPFNQQRGETKLVTLHFISSLVYLPLNHALELQKQVLSNKVMYNLRGTFKVKVSIGLIHFSYWLHGKCELEMTSPPIGMLIAKSCRTKR